MTRRSRFQRDRLERLLLISLAISVLRQTHNSPQRQIAVNVIISFYNRLAQTAFSATNCIHSTIAVQFVSLMASFGKSDLIDLLVRK